MKRLLWSPVIHQAYNMTTTFTNEQKFSGQTPIAYNQSGVTYNQLPYMYSGKVGTYFTNQTKN